MESHAKHEHKNMFKFLKGGFHLQKKAIFTLASGVLLAVGLSGCNNNAGTNQYNDNLNPVGYYSNEKINDDRTGLDNDGPVTEIMDRNAGKNNINQTVPLVNEDQHFNNRNVDNSSYYNSYDGKLAKKIENRAEKVKNVNDATVAIRDNDVLIALAADETNQKSMSEQVKKAVQPLAKGKTVHVVTDKGTFSRVEDFNDNLRNNVGPIDRFETDLNDIFDTIGDNVDNPLKKHQ